MKPRIFLVFCLLFMSMAACNLLSGAGTPTGLPAQETPAGLTQIPASAPPPTAESSPTGAPAPVQTATEQPGEETQTPPPETATAAGTEDPRGEEAILILQPGPGSRVVSPIRIAGMADSTFEQNLVVRLVLDDGTELAMAPTTIQSELGQRGPFELELPFEVSEERQAFIQIYDSSARDGGLLHAASVGLLLAPGGPEEIRTVEPHPERIEIFQPALGDSVSGGVVHVVGFALASFEQSLLIEVLDVDGNVIGQQPVIVNAPDLGQPGPFSADIPYTLTEAGPGRVLVRDISPAFGGDAHAASVEIQLQP